MRIKKLSDENYVELGKKEWSHRERDRLGSLSRRLSRIPTAKSRSLPQRPYPNISELLKMGKIRQLRRIKDRSYSKKRYVLIREKILPERRTKKDKNAPIKPYNPHRK